MKKSNLIKTGLVASMLTLSVTTMPLQAKVMPRITSLQSVDVKTETSLERNRLAFSFLENCNLEDLKKWNDPIVTMTPSEAQEIKQYMFDNIIKGETDSYKRAKMIFEWIHKNVKYAAPTDTNIGLRPYDVFTKKIAVCGGYSNLYKAMLNLADIPAAVVSGSSSAGAHAWTAMRINNKWIYSDSTWGGKYFDMSIEEFSKDHGVQNVQCVTLKGDNGILIGFYEGIAVVGVEDGIISVEIPEKYNDLEITSISSDLFSNKYGVERIKVSSKITNIQTENSSTTLKGVDVDAANSVYQSIDGVLFTKGLSQILLYPNGKTETTFTLKKETIKCDFKEIFSNSYLKEINVENGNSKFSSVDGAVYDRDLKQLLMVPEAKETITVPGTVQLDNIALKFKTKLTKVVLENGIKEIPYYAFDGCTSLNEIHIPASVEKIAIEAFNNVNLNNLTIYGEENSFAQTFAESNKIKFVDNKISEVKKEKLEKFIDLCGKVDGTKYSEVTWKEFDKVLGEAKTVLSNSQATQQMVDTVYEKLVKAYLDLRYKPNKELLKALIDEVEKLDENKYTAASWASLQGVLAEAKALLEDKNAPAKEVDMAMKNLNIAVDGLQLNEKVESNDVISQLPSQIVANKVGIQEKDKVKSVVTGDNLTNGMLGSLFLATLTGFLLRKKYR